MDKVEEEEEDDDGEADLSVHIKGIIFGTCITMMGLRNKMGRQNRPKWKKTKSTFLTWGRGFFFFFFLFLFLFFLPTCMMDRVIEGSLEPGARKPRVVRSPGGGRSPGASIVCFPAKPSHLCNNANKNQEKNKNNNNSSNDSENDE